MRLILAPLRAVLVGFCGVLAAAAHASSASLYTGVAILPLVPGFTLYRGVLALPQGRNATAVATLGEAAVISLAIAVGAAFGLAFGRNLLPPGTGSAATCVRPSRRRDATPPLAQDRP